MSRVGKPESGFPGQGLLEVVDRERLVTLVGAVDLVAMDDVTGVFGEPFRRDDFAGENVWFAIYVYRYGLEGTHELNFTHSNEGGPVDAAELGSRRITGFSAQYAS